MCFTPDHQSLKLSKALIWHITCYLPLIFTNMGNLKVVNLKSGSKSSSWNDGLFAIQKQVGNVVHLWKIKDGKLDRYEDGTPNITCTGTNNKGIITTDLMISV